MGKTLLTSVAIVLLAGCLGLAWSLGGWVDVRATRPDHPVVAWLLHNTYEQAVSRRAGDISVPDDLGQAGRMASGAKAFDEMCSLCHTAPDEPPTVQSQGLNPAAPDLVQLASRRSPAEAYWVIKNGVRMTGMPAFGPTHDDRQLWDLVAFLQQVEGMAVKDYVEFIAVARHGVSAGDGHAHRHGSGTRDDPDSSRQDQQTLSDEYKDSSVSGMPPESQVPATGHPHEGGQAHEH